MTTEAKKIFDLLRGATSIPVVSTFLKDKGLTHSAGSWDAMWEKRVEPHLADKAITVEDLRDLLRLAEEHGRQHVFLYRLKREKIVEVLDAGLVRAKARSMGIESIMDVPLAVELPDSPSFVDIRLGRTRVNDRTVSYIVFKQVETRTTRRLFSEVEEEGFYVRRYSQEKKRAVNIATIYTNGLLELRIAARDAQTKYREDVRQFLGKLQPFVDWKDLNFIRLDRFKNSLWRNRVALREQIRFISFTAIDDEGNSLAANSGAIDADLSEATSLGASVQSFMDGDGFGSASNIYFKIPGSDPPREVHVYLSGEVNEFAVNGNCSAEDYSYVLEQIISLNS